MERIVGDLLSEAEAGAPSQLQTFLELERHAQFRPMDCSFRRQHARKKQKLTHLEEVDISFPMSAQERLERLL